MVLGLNIGNMETIFTIFLINSLKYRSFKTESQLPQLTMEASVYLLAVVVYLSLSLLYH